MGVTAGVTTLSIPFWNLGAGVRDAGNHTSRLSQIIKDHHYLVDNVACNRLSDLRDTVNDKARGDRRQLG